MSDLNLAKRLLNANFDQIMEYMSRRITRRKTLPTGNCEFNLHSGEFFRQIYSCRCRRRLSEEFRSIDWLKFE